MLKIIVCTAVYVMLTCFDSI